MKLVVGLGNVGKRYLHTRHNIGFMVVEELARTLAREVHNPTEAAVYGARFVDWKLEDKLKSSIAKVDLGSDEIVLARPTTMMNGSGDAVQRIMQKYRVAPADVWVVYDDVDVDFGKLRLRLGATSGQQGIRSITSTIGSNFIHVRMGISLNDRVVEPSEVYVLKPFNDSEALQLPTIVASAASTLASELRREIPNETTFQLI
jgi:PTH1 family peptidyl-tRNA hydrolase